MDIKYDIEIPEIVFKEIAGEANSEEIIQVEKWIELSAENRAEYLRIKTLEISSKNVNISVNSKKAWEKISSKINSVPNSNTLKVEKRFIPQKFLRYAATILILVGIALSIFYFTSNKNSEIIIAQTNNNIQEIILPDNSVVTLNKNSTLEYPKKFIGTNREVKLSGEAFFKIKRNPQNPFLVHSANSTVKVLGTAFNVEAYKTANTIIVSVESGKVQFANETGSKVLLEKGNSAILNKTSNILKKNTETDENYLAWKTGIISFNNSTLEKVTTALSKIFDIKFVFKTENLKQCRITTTFDNQTKENIMLVISATLNLRIKKHNEKTYEVEGRPCSP